MYFGLSEDQIFFQDNVKKFLVDQLPLETIKKITEGKDVLAKEELHRSLISLGINNILIPEKNGGLGLDFSSYLSVQWQDISCFEMRLKSLNGSRDLGYGVRSYSP